MIASLKLPAKHYQGKTLRRGYTTGACAAAAAQAAAILLLSGRPLSALTLTLPRGQRLTLPLADLELGPDFAGAAVQKDGGDDPDITHGLLIQARVRKTPADIVINGGEGVGRVTKPGLDQPVGAAAINSTPRRMIREGLEKISRDYGYRGGLDVEIAIPKGRELAKRTFNPRLGIEGGLSVIGTTGIVEPMSHQALADTLRLEIRQLAAGGARSLLLTLGNYSADFARNRLGLNLASHVSCANLIGDALDAAVEEGFRNILLVGQVGKLVKLGIGVTNTHSNQGDGRLETLTACALEAGASLPMLHDILHCVSTQAALTLLEAYGLLDGAMAVLGERIRGCLARQVPEQVRIGFICFGGSGENSQVLAQSNNAQQLLEEWR